MLHVLISPFVACRSIWSCQCLWTNIPPATRTPAAPPAPRARTLSSPTMLELRSPACQSSLPTPTGQPLRNADTSSPFRQTLTFPSLPASWGWTFPHIPRDEAKKTLVKRRKELRGHLVELDGSRGLKSAAVSQFLVVTMFMGHFVLTGVAVCHGLGEKSRLPLFSPLWALDGSGESKGLTVIMSGFCLFCCFFPSMVVSSVVRDYILPFRPNPENILPRDTASFTIFL